ncbi:Uncharacterised protein [Mycoplasmopsis arginini]|nr:Uncharacterised protein [Chlamydia abortus]SGA18343.1 Uncharacterised protein [Mycoplasmopsis arginini]SGA32754.1 Uncharacterised protein [Chlamydia abortus]
MFVFIASKTTSSRELISFQLIVITALFSSTKFISRLTFVLCHENLVNCFLKLIKTFSLFLIELEKTKLDFLSSKD